MAFHSYSFLAFFPLVTLIYFLLPKKGRWLFLLAASYYFYMCWNARYALLIAASTVVTYACARLTDALEASWQRRLALLLSLAINLGILFFFKYYNFCAGLAGRMLSALGGSGSLPMLDLLLPVGISFYTFQALGYTFDVYRRRLPAEKSLLRYALFVSFFPQLVAGPIERSENLLRQINAPRSFDWSRAVEGLRIMLLGYFEKLLIADRASLLVDEIFASWQLASGWQLALAMIAFMFQIYGDFSGYSHIAIGAARVLGYDLMQNFRQPFFADSVRDFWRRWHISLSTWFRDYLYIPMGGSRVGPVRKAVNTLVTFAVSGLWHGASLNFLVWGLLNGAAQIAEGFLPRKKGPRVLRTLATFSLMAVIFVFFRIGALGTALAVLRRMVTAFARPGMALQFGADQALALLAAIAVLLLLDALHERGRTLCGLLSPLPQPVRLLLTLCAILMIVVFGVWGSGYSSQAFIYFQF